MWLGLALSALVGMAQVGEIVQEVTPTGEFSVTTLYGPGQLLSTSLTATTNALNAWAVTSERIGALPAWLYLHLALDVPFIVGYGLLGFALLPAAERRARRLLAALIAADVAEDVIAAVAFTRVIGHHDALFPVVVILHVATAVKWLAALTLLVHVVYRAWDSSRARRAIGRLFLALWEQRFSVIVVLLLAVLAVGRGADVLEQMPDVQRAWLAWPPGRGWVHAGVAVAAQLLLALLLVFLGRMRTRRAKEKFSGTDERHDPGYLPWIAVPAALAGVALVLRLTGAAEVGWWRLGVAVAVPSLIAASSAAISWYYRRRGGSDVQPRPDGAAPGWWLRSRLRARPREHGVTDYLVPDADGVPSLGHHLPRQRPEQQREKVDSVRTAGDALAVAVIAVTGLGLVRSFTALALVGAGGYAVASWVAVVLGIAVATVSWPFANGPVRACLRKLASRAAPRRPLARLACWASQGQLHGESGLWPSLWPWLAAGTPFLIADACLLFVPLWTTHWLGVLGTTVIAVGTLAVGLAVLAYLAQTQRPMPLFRMIRLNVTPVITIIVLIGVLGAIVDSRSLLHQIRGPIAGGPAAMRQSRATSLPAALQSWLTASSTAACAVPAASGTSGAGRPVRVAPLILVAAAGGGIRAAWWAEHALADLAVTRCGPHDVFAVSSVSGGSLGAAVIASAPVAQANADIEQIAGPDALAAGINGLLLHDLIAGYTGLDLSAAQMPPGQRFSDRAGLIESAWQSEDGNLSKPFPLQSPSLPWRLLFNSTTVGSGCRAIIADRSPTARPQRPDNHLTCDLRSAVPGGDSYDFFAKLPCMRNIATVTAAMLSARFPYITPSGVVTGCRDQYGKPVGQFVDGGYADSSGLMTLGDLMPGLIDAVRAHNAAALARPRPGQPVTVVVPIAVYLGNSPRPVPVTSAPVLTQEPLVPIHASSAAGAQLLVSDTLLQRIMGILGHGQWLRCVPALPGCAAAVSAGEKTIPDQIIFVSPRTEPRISAPLGWILSAASQNALNTALGEEENPAGRCLQAKPPDVCQPGVGRMADLLQLIRDG
jgi:hypothetical protein